MQVQIRWRIVYHVAVVFRIMPAIIGPLAQPQRAMYVLR
jgi:hypothetical protein